MCLIDSAANTNWIKLLTDQVEYNITEFYNIQFAYENIFILICKIQSMFAWSEGFKRKPTQGFITHYTFYLDNNVLSSEGQKPKHT